MTSFGADGGIVSTAAESMQLLRAFFGGKLFPAACLTEMQLNWNAIFYPLKYGTGLAKFQLPAVFTMFRKYPALIGHSGLSGAFAYYVPDKDIWLTGTVNQVSHPDISYKLMVQILAELMKKT
jgi:CubicO group peptidase (beta-lactamase class C family)